jgi:hypothetical protein
MVMDGNVENTMVHNSAALTALRHASNSFRVRHDTDSAVLIEVRPAGFDCSCFKVACFEVLSAFRSPGRPLTRSPFLFPEVQYFRNGRR